MHCKVKKYARKDGSETPTYLVVNQSYAEELGLKHGMIVDVPERQIKVVKE
jgi:anaerobic selenocysteine-containing dehydrogenase